jgi:hypothetical protein
MERHAGRGVKLRIFATMLDTVQPRSFEELAWHGFEDVPPGLSPQAIGRC